MLYIKLKTFHVSNHIIIQEYVIAKLHNLPNCESIFYSMQNVDIAQQIDILSIYYVKR